MHYIVGMLSFKEIWGLVVAVRNPACFAMLAIAVCASMASAQNRTRFEERSMEPPLAQFSISINDIAAERNTPGFDRKLAHVRGVVREVIRLKYPNLANYRILLTPLEGDPTSFFQAQPDFLQVATVPSERQNYYLQINPRIFSNYPGDRAVAAIAAHELSHIDDYVEITTRQLLVLGSRYNRALTVNENFVISLERSTDEIAIRKGAGPGLVEYRNWLYQTIGDDPAAVEWKRRAYYTPSEIEAYVSHHRDSIEPFDGSSLIRYRGLETAILRWASPLREIQLIVAGLFLSPSRER